MIGKLAIWFGNYKPQYVITAVIALMFSAESSTAVTPQENFTLWYTEWIEHFPKWSQATIEEFSGREKEKPLVRNYTNWEYEDYRLGTLVNSEANNSSKLLVNPQYSARIVATLDSPDPKWNKKDFAFRSDDRFSAVIANFGVSPGFLDDYEALFSRPHEIGIMIGVKGSSTKSQIIWKYDANALTTDRQPLLVQITLDDEIDGMPVEVSIAEHGGNKRRSELKGWKQHEGSWTYDTKTVYLLKPDRKDEELHSVVNWTFDTPDDQPTAEQCRLSYYGLPEPESQQEIPLVAIAIIAILLILIGIALLFRKTAL